MIDNNVIDFVARKRLLSKKFQPDEDCWEDIWADVAINVPGQGISIAGAGCVDVYPASTFLGVTVTAPSGLQFLAAIPAPEAAKVLHWALGWLRELR